MLTVGSLFSGIGGFDLGLERAGMTVKWQVENDPYCNRVLAKHWPNVQRYGDIKSVEWSTVESVDLVCGGWPCQPFSLAGKRRGKADDRYLWPEVVRCLAALRPAWFLGENVPGIINLGLDQVCADLEGLGYQVWPSCLPACAVDAPHIRQRVWILAHTRCLCHYGGGCKCGSKKAARTCNRSARSSKHAEHVADPAQSLFDRGRDAGAQGRDEPSDQGEDVSNTRRPLLQGRERWAAERATQWLPEPELGRVAYGIPHRVDRLRGLGNAVVPQIVEALGRMIVEVSHDHH